MPSALQSLLNEIEAECANIRDGTLTIEHGAIRPLAVDQFDILPKNDFWALDESYVRCSRDSSFRCGTGGCPVHFIRAGTVTTELAWSWRPIEMSGTTLVLLELHPGRCGTHGHCFKVMNLDETTGAEISVDR